MTKKSRFIAALFIFSIQTSIILYFYKETNQIAMTKEEMLELSRKVCKNTLMETLDIEFTEIGEDYLVAKMPVIRACISRMAYCMEEQPWPLPKVWVAWRAMFFWIPMNSLFVA